MLWDSPAPLPTLGLTAQGAGGRRLCRAAGDDAAAAAAAEERRAPRQPWPPLPTAPRAFLRWPSFRKVSHWAGRGAEAIQEPHGVTAPTAAPGSSKEGIAGGSPKKPHGGIVVASGHASQHIMGWRLRELEDRSPVLSQVVQALPPGKIRNPHWL